MKLMLTKCVVAATAVAYLICVIDARCFAAGQNNLPDVIKTTNQAANKAKTNSGKPQTQTNTSNNNTMSGTGSTTPGSNVGRNDNTTTKREKTSRQPAHAATKKNSRKTQNHR